MRNRTHRRARQFVATLSAVASVCVPFASALPAHAASVQYGGLALELQVQGGELGYGDLHYGLHGTYLRARGLFEASGTVSYEPAPAGTYEISLTDEGYTIAFSGACDSEGSMVVAPGETALCVITATAAGWEGIASGSETGVLTVRKEIVSPEEASSGGVTSYESFGVTVGSTSAKFGPEGEVTLVLPAGSHTVTEAGVAGYAATYGGDCAADGSVTVPAGGSAECVITNTAGVGGFNPGSAPVPAAATPAPAPQGSAVAVAQARPAASAPAAATPAVTASASPQTAAIGGEGWKQCVVEGGWLTTLVIVVFALAGLLLILVTSLRGGRAFVLLFALALVLYWLGSGCAEPLGWLPFALAGVVYILLGRTPDAA